MAQAKQALQYESEFIVDAQLIKAGGFVGEHAPSPVPSSAQHDVEKFATAMIAKNIPRPASGITSVAPLQVEHQNIYEWAVRNAEVLYGTMHKVALFLTGVALLLLGKFSGTRPDLAVVVAFAAAGLGLIVAVLSRAQLHVRNLDRIELSPDQEERILSILDRMNPKT